MFERLIEDGAVKWIVDKIFVKEKLQLTEIVDTTLSGTPIIFTLYDSTGTPYYFKAYPTKV